MGGFILSHFSGLIAGMIAGTIAALVHARWSTLEGWYANRSHVVQAALGVVVAGGLAAFGTFIPNGGAIVQACTNTGSDVLSQGCLDAIGAWFTKDNLAGVIGILLTLVTHVTGAVKENTRITKLMAQKAGIPIRPVTPFDRAP